MAAVVNSRSDVFDVAYNDGGQYCPLIRAMLYRLFCLAEQRICQMPSHANLMFPLVFLLETFGFAQLSVRLLKGYIQRISRFLTFLLRLLAFELELAIMPAAKLGCRAQGMLQVASMCDKHAQHHLVKHTQY